jgi:hypothetical protein
MNTVGRPHATPRAASVCVFYQQVIGLKAQQALDIMTEYHELSSHFGVLGAHSQERSRASIISKPVENRMSMSFFLCYARAPKRPNAV